MKKRTSRILSLTLLCAMVLGLLVCYAFGTAWYCFQAGSSVGAALGLCVFPFIPGDLV